MTGKLVVMGSGETAPTMMKPHREVFAATAAGPAVLLDTPYGFQENADDISRRAVKYFDESVGRKVDVVSWREPSEDVLDRERALAAIRDAAWVFAGPGSPTYAMRQWDGTPLPELFEDTVASGGTLLFASAAALTLGSHVVPVYEVYKAGAAPYWEPGLDLFRRVTGLPAVVIPHYNNAEGGHHDTRYCYLGERRLRGLEQELPEETFILGVDEHTACVVDLGAGTVGVLGTGTVTVRRRGASRVFASGTTIGIEELAADPGATATGSAGPAGEHGEARTSAGNGATSLTPPTPAAVPSLRQAALDREHVFNEAVTARDVDACVVAMLELEQEIADWGADTEEDDDGPEVARAVLRRMVVRLGELAVAGARDPREVVGPYVELLLDQRARVRAAKDFAASDQIRDCLISVGVEVSDTPEGVAWRLCEPRS